MWHFIKCFGKIKQNDIYLIFPRVQLAGDALDGGDQLRFARPSLSKSMLLVTENVVPLKVVHDATVDYMLTVCYRFLLNFSYISK